MKLRKDKNSPKKVKILDISITSTPEDKVLNQVQEKIEKGEKFYIVTPNPEQVMMAAEDELLGEILNSAEFSLPDGIGLIAAYKYSLLPRPKSVLKRFFALLGQGVRIGLAVVFDQKWLQSELKLVKGRKFFEKLLIRMNNVKLGGQNCVCVFVGDNKSSAQRAASVVREKLKNLQIYAFTGPQLDKSGNLKESVDVEAESRLIRKISKINPHILYVGFGSPKQEKWLYRNFEKLKFSCAGLVGGTFDCISGVRKPVPQWIEEFNFEWLYRLFTGSQQPGRIFSAFPQFVFRVFLDKLVGR